jgi:selenocysteine lyase/cysteine desulfurase
MFFGTQVKFYPLTKSPIYAGIIISCYYVDAAQSVGVIPLNLTELSVYFYAFTGYKWLCRPAGVGGLYLQS